MQRKSLIFVVRLAGTLQTPFSVVVNDYVRSKENVNVRHHLQFGGRDYG